MTKKSAPFKLPAKPVDGFTVEYWSIASSSMQAVHYKCVYHVNASWQSVCPGDKLDGAPFVNDWQIFENGRFSGRNVGWAEAFDHYSWEYSYATRDEANKALIKYLHERAQRLRAEADKAITLADKLQQELGS